MNDEFLAEWQRKYQLNHQSLYDQAGRFLHAGLERHDQSLIFFLTIKPSFDAYQVFMVFHPGDGHEVWGELRAWDQRYDLGLLYRAYTGNPVERVFEQVMPRRWKPTLAVQQTKLDAVPVEKIRSQLFSLPEALLGTDKPVIAIDGTILEMGWNKDGKMQHSRWRAGTSALDQCAAEIACLFGQET